MRTSADLEPWIGAAVRALAQCCASSEKDLNRWVKTHQNLLAQIKAGTEDKGREQAAA